MASFYYFGVTFREGSPVPATSHTILIKESGRAISISESEKTLRDGLQSFGFGGIPAILLSGAVLHFVVGVRRFQNTPFPRK